MIPGVLTKSSFCELGKSRCKAQDGPTRDRALGIPLFDGRTIRPACYGRILTVVHNSAAGIRCSEGRDKTHESHYHLGTHPVSNLSG